MLTYALLGRQPRLPRGDHHSALEASSPTMLWRSRKVESRSTRSLFLIFSTYPAARVILATCERRVTIFCFSRNDHKTNFFSEEKDFQGRKKVARCVGLRIFPLSLATEANFDQRLMALATIIHRSNGMRFINRFVRLPVHLRRISPARASADSWRYPKSLLTVCFKSLAGEDSRHGSRVGQLQRGLQSFLYL